VFEYPSHFIYPEDKPIWFKDHMVTWEDSLKHLKDKSNICLEIGSFHGASTVYIRENFCNSKDSHLYVMDINESDYLKSNLSPYDNITFMKGESRDLFKNLNHNGQYKEFLDFVYIDGSHMSFHVLEDAVNSFYCLKDNGVIIFDDYLGGLEQESHLQVKVAVDAFMHAYHKHLRIFMNGYQIGFVKKMEFSSKDLKINYY